jgi:hypothetical protein
MSWDLLREEISGSTFPIRNDGQPPSQSPHMFADHRSMPNRLATFARTPCIASVNADRGITAVAIATFPERR